MSPTPRPFACLLSLALLVIAAGCTPPEKQVRRVLDQTLTTCQAAPGDFAEIELFSGEKIQVLKQACAMPVENFKVEDKITGTAQTGPYQWKISTHPDSGIWVLSDITWQDINDARRILEMEKPDSNSLAHAEKKFAQIEKLMPENSWVRRERLNNALRLRKATRAKDHNDDAVELTGIGSTAQSAYDSVLEFAREKNMPELEAQARLAVLEYHQAYEEFLANTLEGSGEQDEWVQAAIDLAVKEKKKEEEAKYRKELAERQETRQVREVEFKARKEKVHQLLCKELGELKSDGIKDQDLVASIHNMKSNIQCTPAAEAPVTP